jgi:hypothetical protein
MYSLMTTKLRNMDGEMEQIPHLQQEGEKKLIFLDGNPLSAEDFNSLMEQV